MNGDMNEDQWAALREWVIREAKDYGNGTLSRSYITQEEQAARVAFGLPKTPDGYREKMRAETNALMRDIIRATGESLWPKTLARP